jgi:hypothetical protein
LEKTSESEGAMPATYVDQVQKLDIRSMMGAAFKACPSDHYTVGCDVSGWHALARGQAAPPTDKIVACIQLNRTPDKSATLPWCGQVTLTLQLPICFKVRALSGGLVSSTPE